MFGFHISGNRIGGIDLRQSVVSGLKILTEAATKETQEKASRGRHQKWVILISTIQQSQNGILHGDCFGREL